MTTCVKYMKKTTAGTSSDGAELAANKVPRCRFWFFQELIFKIVDAG